jgi:isoprenylcysteine carboxyl methyltransferase (ICMT) family protein YpbQ
VLAIAELPPLAEVPPGAYAADFRSVRANGTSNLGRAWSIQLDRADASKHSIVRDGPYRWIRHPIYAGAMIETLGLALPQPRRFEG